ncbi:MAG TPA: hypothetical protein PK294_13405 [Ignavibacteria bacterium]|nr:hypothetical protein [Ignavibacteria bacterium]HQY53037.1 hypothetical protein [Ignavibacteria bacterium]HRB01424.1 hypothetical protein [Ignavibacteria bacterium]
MEDLINSFLNNVGIRHDGPMSFRLFLQPAMSLIYAIIAGVKDAKAGNPHFLEGFILGKVDRKTALKEIWKNVGKVFILAAVMEIIFEIIEFKTVHPFEVLKIAFFLAILPYLIFRGIVDRIVSLFIKKGS